ncbi:MAG: hypothetical protein JJV98_16095 [Desulfosarcina sp.]|nr:hypothetical protein [Desulfobacterales bacterium]
MGFQPASNIKGRIFIPDETPEAEKKYTCPDCFQCQMCSNDRCQICRATRQYVPEGQAAMCACAQALNPRPE